LLLAFFESFKYLAHLWPVTLLRVYLGYLFFETAMKQVRMGFLKNPELIRDLFNQWLTRGCHSPFLGAIQAAVDPANPIAWKVSAYYFVVSETVVGISYILGYCVRPAALIGIALAGFILMGTAEGAVLQKTYLAVHATLMLLGAGRCLGFDFYFFKRTRGIMW